MIQCFCNFMANNKRFLGEIFSGLLALGSVADSPSVEKPRGEVRSQEVEKREEQKEIGPEMDPIFRVEHPMETEMRMHIHGFSKEKREERLASMKHAMEVASDLVASHRYTNEKSEKEYFAVCYDTEKWNKIVKIAEFASEKTKIPLQVILAMGFIESKMNPRAKNEKTGAIGIMQIKRGAADDAAKLTKQIYGFEIKITSDKDLFDPEINIQLGAVHLSLLEKRLGQLGLAIAAYSSSESVLYEKLSKAFPEIDFGEDDWKEMQKQHDAQIATHEDYMKLVKIAKTDHATKFDHEVMLKSYKAFSDAVNAYKAAKKSWMTKREAIPKELEISDVTILTLFESIEAEGDIPHSITYALAIPDVSKRMQKQIAIAQQQTNPRITSAQ